MTEAILGLGSNIGDKSANLTNAIKFLDKIPEITVTKISNYYNTEPFGVPDEQDNYVNCCIKISTSLSAHTILGVCLGVEAAMGRERPFKFSSRIIDIDLLLYGQESYDTAELAIPHPHIKERAFVLIPLKDVCQGTSFYNFDFGEAFESVVGT